MNSKNVARYCGTFIILGMVIGAMLLGGCGGDAGSCGFGGARGYVYQSETGCSILISASPIPPDGYRPVAADTVVRIEGYPELVTYTHSDGFYYFPAIPAGTHVLVVESPCGVVTLSIPIIANRITEGGGHSEGGGGGGGGGGDAPFTTFTQGGWGAVPQGGNAGTLLHNNFTRVFPNGVRLGVPNGVTFTSAQQVTDFLPQGGTPGIWTENQTLPIVTSTAGIFAGQVLALQLSVSFSMAGVTPTGLADMKVAKGAYTGYTVADLLILSQRILGGDTSVTLPTSLSELNDTITKINENYVDGATDRRFLK